MTIGEKIIIYRAKNKVSQKKFAEMIGTDQPYLSQIENGREPGKIIRTRIELVLNEENENVHL